MDGVLAHRGRELLADGALGRVGGVGCADHLAPLRDGVVALEDEGHAGAARHELGELTEERALGVNGVEALRLREGQGRELHRADGEALVENAVEDLAGVAVGDGVGLDDGERALHVGLGECGGQSTSRACSRPRNAEEEASIALRQTHRCCRPHRARPSPLHLDAVVVRRGLGRPGATWLDRCHNPPNGAPLLAVDEGVVQGRARRLWLSRGDQRDDLSRSSRDRLEPPSHA